MRTVVIASVVVAWSSLAAADRCLAIPNALAEQKRVEAAN
jgi:hypothetical protein